MAGAVFGEVGGWLFVTGAALRDILGDSRSAKCCILQYKIVSKMGRVRSPKRRVRDDDFILGYRRISSDILPKGSNLTLLHPKVISESAFTVKSAFDTKSAIGKRFYYQKRFWYQKWYRKSPIAEWYHHFPINDIVFIITLTILKLYMFFMFVTHTACVSTKKTPSQDFSAWVWSVKSCTSRLAYL